MNEGVNPPAIVQSAPASTEHRRGSIADDQARLRKLVAKQLRNFTALFARALAEEDAGTVHDLRVCTRRLQQILAAIAAQKDLGKLRSVRRTLRRVRRALGEWRNCDVALQTIARIRRRVSNPLRKQGWELIGRSVSATRERAVQTARRRLYKSGGITLNHRIQQLLELAAQRQGNLEPGIAVRNAVAQGTTQWRQALERATADRAVESIHALRIQGKRLRYRLELARDLGAAQAPAFINWFKLLQDRLGHWHDREELNRFIARAIARSDIMLEQPRVAIELLRQIEGGIKASSREIDEFFRMAGESPNARQLDDWLQTYCAAAGAAANEAQSARDASGSEPQSAPADSVHSSNPDAKGQN